MAMTAQLWSINGLATELGRDRRAVGKMLAGLTPDGGSDRSPRWLMQTAISALVEKSGDLDLTEERARLAKEQADKTALENAARRGDLLDRADVDAAVIASFARVRARLLAIPAKSAPLAVQADGPNEAEAILRAAVIEALRELAETDVSKLSIDHGDMVAGADSTAGPDDKPVGGRRKAAKPRGKRGAG